jgi:hypothetical protein
MIICLYRESVPPVDMSVPMIGMMGNVVFVTLSAHTIGMQRLEYAIFAKLNAYIGIGKMECAVNADLYASMMGKNLLIQRRSRWMVKSGQIMAMAHVL